MLFLGGHNHCVKVSSNSETVRGMGLWEFSGALRELMLKNSHGNGWQDFLKVFPMHVYTMEKLDPHPGSQVFQGINVL